MIFIDKKITDLSSLSKAYPQKAQNIFAEELDLSIKEMTRLKSLIEKKKGELEEKCRTLSLINESKTKAKSIQFLSKNN